jgi:hypothetical protein
LEILGDMKKTKEKKELLEKTFNERQAVSLAKCSFSWGKLIEMKDTNVEFFAGDGYQRLRIFDIDGKTKSLYMVSELGRITWPLRFEKLERIHEIIHCGKVALVPYEIDKLIPTWGNFVTGLFRYLGCSKTE